MTTVADLRSLLESMDDDREVLIVHQIHWPLREVIGGLYDPLTANDRELVLATEDDDLCSVCEQSLKGAMAWHDWDDDNDMPRWVCVDCTKANEEAEGEQPVYLVANGHPYNGSPYGPRAAWRAL